VVSVHHCNTKIVFYYASFIYYFRFKILSANLLLLYYWLSMATFFSQIRHTYTPKTGDNGEEDVDAATFLAATRESLALLGNYLDLQVDNSNGCG